MQFTASTIAFVAALMASQVSGLPHELSQRAQMCGSAPAGSGSFDPFSTPSAATADACHTLCAADTKCLSFAFGLPPSATAPVCELFACAGAQVPAQQTNLVIFDKACSDIPTTAPTTAYPHGQTAAQQAQNGGQTGSNTGGQNGGQTGSNTGAQTGSNTGNTGSTGAQTGSTGAQTGSTGGSTGKQQKRANCGAAPTGPATSTPSPLKTDPSVTSSPDCLALCKKTSGCQSVLFGKPSADGANECILYSVPSSQLPAPTAGQSFVGFDQSC